MDPNQTNEPADVTWQEIQETAEENPQAAEAIVEMLIEAEEDIFKDADRL